MRRLLTTIARFAVMALIAAVLVAWPESASARMVPQTLADRQPVGRGPVEPGFAIGYVGVFWDGELEHDHGEDGEAASHGAVRFRTDGVWGPWIRLIEDGVESRGRWASGLVSVGGAEAYQVRGVPEEAVRPRAVALNTTDGPLVEVATAAGGAAEAVASSMCRSRAEWGADESLRFDSDGNEIFPPAYYDAQVMTVHHTATTNDDPDPAGTVRAIYRYHAVDQGWGDIGYQYLVDESGVVYEGRWSGTESPLCSSGGDGREFAHEAGGDRMVTGAHTGGWNSGNLGVALLGEFTDHPRFGADPKATAVEALEDLLAELAVRHGIDATAEVTYVNPVSGESKHVDTIGGHRDYTATECPGERLYDLLPGIRQDVKTKMSTFEDSAPTVVVDQPADGSTVSGSITLTASATDDNGVVQVEFTVDGASIAVDTSGSDGWSVGWDTTAQADGGHTVAAVATDTVGQTASQAVTVTVDNVADTPPPAMHVGDLDGESTSVKSGWRATVATTVLTGEEPLKGAEVRGSWSTGETGTCTTDASGVCSVTSSTLRKTISSVGFSVDDLVLDGYTYDSARNGDPDGDSNGTSITVLRP
jgi:hypothetical protein